MFQETHLTGGRFYHAAVGREIALEHGKRALLVDRVLDRADDVIIMDFGARDVVAERFSGHGDAVEMQMLPDPAHQPRQAAGIEKIFHQIAVAARPYVGDHRYLAARLLEIVEPDVLA